MSVIYMVCRSSLRIISCTILIRYNHYDDTTRNIRQLQYACTLRVHAIFIMDNFFYITFKSFDVQT